MATSSVSGLRSSYASGSGHHHLPSSLSHTTSSLSSSAYSSRCLYPPSSSGSLTLPSSYRSASSYDLMNKVLSPTSSNNYTHSHHLTSTNSSSSSLTSSRSSSSSSTGSGSSTSSYTTTKTFPSYSSSSNSTSGYGSSIAHSKWKVYWHTHSNITTLKTHLPSSCIIILHPLTFSPVTSQRMYPF